MTVFDDFDDVDMTSQWLRSEPARRMARQWAANADNAYKELCAACEQTTDPGVAKAYARFVALAECAAVFNPKGKR